MCGKPGQPTGGMTLLNDSLTSKQSCHSPGTDVAPWFTARMPRTLAEILLDALADADRRGIRSEWREASLFSRSVVALASAELAELNAEYLALVQRWTVPRDTPSDARPVRLAMFAFPDEEVTS